MSGTFSVGDVVVCVDLSRKYRTAPVRLRLGAIYKVAATDFSRFDGEQALVLHGLPKLAGTVGFRAFRFRHLPKADDAFTAEMRACRPVRESEPA